MEVRQPAFKNPEKIDLRPEYIVGEGIAMKHPEFLLCFRINFHLFCMKHFILVLSFCLMISWHLKFMFLQNWKFEAFCINQHKEHWKQVVFLLKIES